MLNLSLNKGYLLGNNFWCKIFRILFPGVKFSGYYFPPNLNQLKYLLTVKNIQITQCCGGRAFLFFLLQKNKSHPFSFFPFLHEQFNSNFFLNPLGGDNKLAIHAGEMGQGWEAWQPRAGSWGLSQEKGIHGGEVCWWLLAIGHLQDD